MGILSWDRPKRVMSQAERDEISADGAPPGVYQPNMSAADRAKWKAKVVGQTTGFPQVEIRKDSTVVVVSLRGYKYKHYNTRQTPEAIAKAKNNQWRPEPDAPAGWPTVHIASAGPMVLTLTELDDFMAAIEEARKALREIGK